MGTSRKNNEPLLIEAIFPIFPKLQRCRKTSDPDEQYNCLAWAANDNKNWWDPFTGYWPDGAIKSYSLEACIDAFKKYGFEVCKNPDPEEGLEKIAIWSKGNEYEHAARLRDNGKWTSKIGAFEDADHDLSDLDSTDPQGYGNVACYMKRPKKQRPRRR